MYWTDLALFIVMTIIAAAIIVKLLLKLVEEYFKYRQKKHFDPSKQTCGMAYNTETNELEGGTSFVEPF